MQTLLRLNDAVFAKIEGQDVAGTIVSLNETTHTAVISTARGTKHMVRWWQLRRATEDSTPMVTRDPRTAMRRILDLVRPSQQQPLLYETAVYCSNCHKLDHGNGKDGLQTCRYCRTEGMLRIALLLEAQRTQLERQCTEIDTLREEIVELRKRPKARLVGIIPAGLSLAKKKNSHNHNL